MIRKILVVDDDLILRVALQKRLAACRDSFAVITAADGFEAVKELKKFPFSLIVTDLIMPRLDGMSLIAHTRENYPDLPIIVISANQAPQIEEKVKASGVLACLGKPFRADDLVSLIMNSLRKEADGGIMYDVSPAVFLQLIEMDAKTCTVRVLDKTSEKGGIVYFIDGRLVDARVGERQGIDAAYEIFTWDVVTLFIHNGCNPRKNAINSDLQPIIMKAVGMKDESDGSGNSGEDERSKLVLARIKDILMKAGGADCFAGFSYDEKVGQAVEHLQEIGKVAGFGPFQAGLVKLSGEKHDKIFLPGQPAPAFTVRAASIRPHVLEKIKSSVDTSRHNRE